MASKGNSPGGGDLEEDIVELLDQGDSSDLALGTVQGPVSGEDQEKSQGGINDGEVGGDASFSELFRAEKAQIGYVQIDGGEANDAQAVALSAICSQPTTGVVEEGRAGVVQLFCQLDPAKLVQVVQVGRGRSRSRGDRARCGFGSSRPCRRDPLWWCSRIGSK